MASRPTRPGQVTRPVASRPSRRAAASADLAADRAADPASGTSDRDPYSPDGGIVITDGDGAIADIAEGDGPASAAAADSATDDDLTPLSNAPPAELTFFIFYSYSLRCTRRGAYMTAKDTLVGASLHDVRLAALQALGAKDAVVVHGEDILDQVLVMEAGEVLNNWVEPALMPAKLLVVLPPCLFESIPERKVEPGGGATPAKEEQGSLTTNNDDTSPYRVLAYLRNLSQQQRISSMPASEQDGTSGGGDAPTQQEPPPPPPPPPLPPPSSAGQQPSSRRRQAWICSSETACCMANTLADSYTWHGVKSLYTCSIFFALIVLAVWCQTEPGATAFKSSVITSFSDYDTGNMWEKSTLDGVTSIADAFEYLTMYMKSVVKKSADVQPEAGSFVYLGDFAHITFAQLKIEFPDLCSTSSTGVNNATDVNTTAGVNNTAPTEMKLLETTDVRQKIDALRDSADDFVQSTEWQNYRRGGSTQPLSDLPANVPLKDTTGGYEKVTAIGSDALVAKVLDVTDRCADMSLRELRVDPTWVGWSLQRILQSKNYANTFSQFEESQFSFLDLVGRLTRTPIQGFADLNLTEYDYDYFDYYDYLGLSIKNETNNDRCGNDATTSLWCDKEAGEADKLCFCADNSTGLPYTLRAYMDPSVPEGTTAIVELVRLWPDFLSQTSLDEVEEGLEYLLRFTAGFVGKYANALTLTLHAYDRRDVHSSVIFSLQATRDVNKGKLDTETLALTLNSRWSPAGSFWMVMVIVATFLDIKYTLRAMQLSYQQGRSIVSYLAGGLSRHPFTWHVLDISHHVAMLAWICFWFHLLNRTSQQNRTVLFPQSSEELKKSQKLATLFTAWLYFGLAMFFLVGVRGSRGLKYHSGLRIFYTLFRLAYRDILEFSVVVVGFAVVLCSVVFGVFIISGGNPLFAEFGKGLSAMTRLSFGFLDYSAFTNDGGGIGSGKPAIIFFFWLSILFLVVIVQNTLLAIFSRAYETAKLATTSGNDIVFVMYLVYDAFFIVRFYMKNVFLTLWWAAITDPMGVTQYVRLPAAPAAGEQRYGLPRRWRYWNEEYYEAYKGEGTASVPSRARLDEVASAMISRVPWYWRACRYLAGFPYRIKIYYLETWNREFEELVVSAGSRRAESERRGKDKYSKRSTTASITTASYTMDRWRIAASPQMRALVSFFTDEGMERLNVVERPTEAPTADTLQQGPRFAADQPGSSSSSKSSLEAPSVRLPRPPSIPLLHPKPLLPAHGKGGGDLHLLAAASENLDPSEASDNFEDTAEVDGKVVYSMWLVPDTGMRDVHQAANDVLQQQHQQWGPVSKFGLRHTRRQSSKQWSAQKLEMQYFSVVELRLYAQAYEEEIMRLLLAAAATAQCLEARRRDAWQDLINGQPAAAAADCRATGEKQADIESAACCGGNFKNVDAVSCWAACKPVTALWLRLKRSVQSLVVLCSWANPLWPFNESVGPGDEGLQDEDLKKLVRAIMAVYGPMQPPVSEREYQERQDASERHKGLQEIKVLMRQQDNVPKGRGGFGPPPLVAQQLAPQLAPAMDMEALRQVVSRAVSDALGRRAP